MDQLTHFWQKDRGIYPSNIIDKCNVQLRQDYYLWIYEATLKYVSCPSNFEIRSSLLHNKPLEFTVKLLF